MRHGTRVAARFASKTFDPRLIDLADLTGELREDFREQAPLGYVPGRTAIRDAVIKRVGCSELEAEQLVDTRISRGFLRYEGDTVEAADRPAEWTLRAHD